MRAFTTVSLRTRPTTGRSSRPSMVRMQKRPSAQVARFRCHCTREQGDLAVESFYRVDSNLGVPLSTDLVSLLLGEGSFVPITNIDLGICRTQAFRSPRTS